MNFDWMTNGLCVGSDPDIWFKSSTIKAREICHRCPVIWECRVYSLTDRLEKGATASLQGVWGGLSAYDRLNRERAEQKLEEASVMLNYKDKLWST